MAPAAHPHAARMDLDAPLVGAPFAGVVYAKAPRNVYWETTIACDLACRHCRADAIPAAPPGELTTAEARTLMDDVKAMGSMLILTGGDPLKRADLFDLISYARSIHLPISITPSTTPSLTEEAVARFRALGVAAMGVSLDGPDAGIHDAFRGVAGTFQHSQNALTWARQHALPVQINTTVTRDTLPHLPAMYALLRDHASPPVRRWSLFVLIPVGRGAQLAAPAPEEIEELFGWVYRTAAAAPFHISTVEAPQYRRYWIQRQLREGTPEAELPRFAKRMGFGVRDGNGVIFVSHTGDVFPAGFLPNPRLGNVRTTPVSEIYRTAPALLAMRDMDQLEGRCGTCEFRWPCGGSRARAWATTGNLLGSDPLCVHQPATAPAGA